MCAVKEGSRGGQRKGVLTAVLQGNELDISHSPPLWAMVEAAGGVESACPVLIILQRTFNAHL